MRVHYSFKYWHGSNWKTRNIYTLNSCFPCSSMKRLDRDVERRQAGARLFFSVIVSTSWRTNFDDRGWSKADLFQRPNRGPEFDGIQFRSGFRPSAVVSARCTVPSVYHANLGRMQIAFHNLLPVPCSLRVYRPDLRLENRVLPPAFFRQDRCVRCIHLATPINCLFILKYLFFNVPLFFLSFFFCIISFVYKNEILNLKLSKNLWRRSMG